MMQKYFQYSLLLLFIINSNGTFVNIDELYKLWSSKILLNITEIGTAGNGIFDFTDIKTKLLQWKTEKLQSLCPSNRVQLQNLLNLVCSTAQPSNVTIRDACISCFSRITALPEGPQELSGLSNCGTTYFANTSYASCAQNLMTLSTSALNVQTTGCYMGYCDFVRCLRRRNTINLITQCTREARTGINITIDSDNVKFYTNVTACILARSRCGTFNPVTGDPQIPGQSSSNIRISNALQIAETGDLRIITFPVNTPVSATFCSAATNLTQVTWLNDVC